MSIVEKQETEYQTNWLQFDVVKLILDDHKVNRYPYYNEMYNNYFMMNPDRQKMLTKDSEEWRSNMVSPLTYMYTSTIYDLAKDAQIILNLGDVWKNVEEEDSLILRDELMDMAQHIMWSQNFMDTFYESFFDAVLLWKGHYSETYFYRKEEEEFTVINEDGTISVEKDETIVDVPWIIYTSPYNIVASGWRRDIDARFKIKRKIVPIEDVPFIYSAYNLQLNSTDLEAIKKWINNVTSWTDYESRIKNMPMWKFNRNYELLQWEDFNSDSIKKIQNKMVEIIEIVDKNKVQIYINGTNKWVYKKLLWYGLDQEKTIRYRKWTDIWVGYVAYEAQKAYDEIVNNRYDNVKLIMNKVFLVDSRLSLLKGEKSLKLYPGKMIMIPWSVSDKSEFVKELQISEIKSSSYEEANAIFQMLQASLWVWANVLGTQGKVERTAEGASIVRWAADRQVKQLIDSAQETLSSTIKDMIILARINMNQKTINKILWEDNLFSSISVEDLRNNYIFDFSIQSQQFGSKATKIQQLMQMVDLSSRLTDSAWTRVWDIKWLWRSLVKEFDINVDADMTEEEIIQEAQKRFNINRVIQTWSTEQPEAPTIPSPTWQDPTQKFSLWMPWSTSEAPNNPMWINW